MAAVANLTFFGLAIGVPPALLWLWFWLKEDKRKPEPKWLLMLAFFAGALAVELALPLQQFVKAEWANQWVVLFGWATIEETLKLVAAGVVAFHGRYFDEPVDTMVYIITAALGFAAFENALFVGKATGFDGSIAGILTGDLRFLGATLLHIVTSGILGGIIALSFYKTFGKKILYTLTALFVAIALHTLFNYFIMLDNGTHTMVVLYSLWGGAVLLLIFFQKIKGLENTNAKR
jgi:RsiW-degrading membrane proteinase PrsW (M82 family)